MVRPLQDLLQNVPTPQNNNGQTIQIPEYLLEAPTPTILGKLRPHKHHLTAQKAPLHLLTRNWPLSERTGEDSVTSSLYGSQSPASFHLEVVLQIDRQRVDQTVCHDSARRLSLPPLRQSALVWSSISHLRAREGEVGVGAGGLDGPDGHVEPATHHTSPDHERTLHDGHSASVQAADNGAPRAAVHG